MSAEAMAVIASKDEEIARLRALVTEYGDSTLVVPKSPLFTACCLCLEAPDKICEKHLRWQDANDALYLESLHDKKHPRRKVYKAVLP